MPVTIQPASLKYKNGNTFQSADCIKGEPGQPGIDGVSPVVSVESITGGHEVTITDASGDHSFDVMDGAKGDPGDPQELIDDTAGSGDTDKTWSADKIGSELSTLNNEIDAKYTKPASGIPASDLESGVIPAVPVQDVQVNGTSILNNGVANVLKASDSNTGVVKTNGQFGLSMRSSPNDDTIMISKASNDTIKSGNQSYQAIVPTNQHVATFYGLAKLAGADMASLSGETVGVYPEAQKIAIQKMLGIYQAPWELIREDTVTNATEADIEITVDGNGNAFELTDVAIAFETPKQDTVSSLGGSGNIRFYYGESSYIVAWVDCWTQAANANAVGTYAVVENKRNLVQISTMRKNSSAVANMGTNWAGGLSGNNMGIQIIDPFVVNKVVIRLVTGTGHYKLYGKRKWT